MHYFLIIYVWFFYHIVNDKKYSSTIKNVLFFHFVDLRLNKIWYFASFFDQLINEYIK